MCILACERAKSGAQLKDQPRFGTGRHGQWSQLKNATGPTRLYLN